MNRRINELNKHINEILQELDLVLSKKLSQAKRIAKAEEILKSKHSEIDEALQKIRRENQDLQREFDQLGKEDLQKELNQLEKNAYRYNPHWVESHHEEQRDMIHQLSEGSLKSIKVFWKNVYKGASS